MLLTVAYFFFKEYYIHDQVEQEDHSTIVKQTKSVLAVSNEVAIFTLFLVILSNRP